MNHNRFAMPARAIALVGVLTATSVAQSNSPIVTKELTPIADATLYEDPVNDLANGAGSRFIVGLEPGGLARRGMLRFDILAEIPRGATIVSAQLEIVEVQSFGAPRGLALSALGESWTEGQSIAPGNEFDGTAALPGDTTWAHREFPALGWGNRGGVSAGRLEIAASGIGDITFTGAYDLPLYLQRVVDRQTVHLGFVITSDERVAGQVSAYASRESFNPPTLTITYLAPSARVRNLGPGCSSGAGEPFALTTFETPTIPNPNFSFQLSNAPAQTPVQAVVFSAPDASLSGGFTWLHPDCRFRVRLGALVDVRPASSVSRPGFVPLPIPANPSLVGVRFAAQGVAVDAGGLVVTSNALDVRLGR